MAQGPAIQTGTFIADGSDKNILLYADVDRVVVENETEIIATNSGHGFRYTWYLGLETSMIKEYHPAADHTCAIDTVSDAILPVAVFSVRDNLTFNAITAGTNSTQPVYSTADTSDLETGSIVRLYDTDQVNLNGLDFTISNVVTNTSFTLESTLATAPGITAGASGKYMPVAYSSDQFDLFAPYEINISNITKATQAVVTTLTDHQIPEQMLVEFVAPAAYGMIEIDGLVGRVSSVTTNTFTVDIDSTGFTSFKFPIYTDVPFELATVAMVDIDETPLNKEFEPYYTKESSGYVAMTLRTGTDKPAGSSGDSIRWTAYNSVGEDDEIFAP